MITLAAATVWCVVQLNTSLESNAPRACFPEKQTCQAYIRDLAIPYAQCERRSRE